jgi:hypothetical protein
MNEINDTLVLAFLGGFIGATIVILSEFIIEKIKKIKEEKENNEGWH